MKFEKILIYVSIVLSTVSVFLMVGMTIALFIIVGANDFSDLGGRCLMLPQSPASLLEDKECFGYKDSAETFFVSRNGLDESFISENKVFIP